jgi:hypothetical protein
MDFILRSGNINILCIVIYLPNCNSELILCATIGRQRGQGTTDSNLIARLNES